MLDSRSGEGWVHVHMRASLWAVVLWERPGREATADLVRSLCRELEDGVAPHRSVVDARRLEGVDAGAFQTLMAYVEGHREALARQVERLALVRPTGLEGAAVAGFFEVLPRPYPVDTFADLAGALAWLDAAPEDAAALDTLVAEASATPAVVSALRAHLDDNPGVVEAAKRMGVSSRTLQRRLKAAGTSYQEELNGARVRAAQRLLRDTDASITAIALDVGCATPQHFSALFRRLVGQSPSDWRMGARALRGLR